MFLDNTIDKSPLVRKRSLQRKKGKRIAINILVILLLVGYALFLMTPFYVGIITSVTDYSEIRTTMSFIWWPEKFDIQDSYVALLTEDPLIHLLGMPSIFQGLLNTLWTSLLTVTVSILASGLAAFAYSKVRFKGRDTLFLIEVATVMFPMTALTIPQFIFYDNLGWTNSFLPVIIPGMFGSASAIFFLKGYMSSSVPTEVIEAAKMDGLGFYGTYFRIVLPECIPGFLGQFIFLFVAYYNSYATPLLYLYGDESMYTLQIALGELRGMFSHSNQLCASAILAIIPLLILYVLLQKYFISGISIGGGKE